MVNFLKFFQSSISCEIYFSRLSWGKNGIKLKKSFWGRGPLNNCHDCSKLNLVWNGCMAQNFWTWLCLLACWLYERLVTISRHWYLLSLGQPQYWPSGAKTSLVILFLETRHPRRGQIFPTIPVIFAGNSIIFLEGLNGSKPLSHTE